MHELAPRHFNPPNQICRQRVHYTTPFQPRYPERASPELSLISSMSAPAAGGAAPARGGFGSRGGDRGRGRGGRRGGRRGGNKSEEKEWQPVTKLGRLVKAGKIRSIEEIYLHSLPIKEFQIVDFFLPKLKDEVMKVSSTSHDRASGLADKVLVDQTRSKANPCRSAYTVQSHRRDRRQRGPRRARHQDLQRSCHRYSRCNHHR